MLEISLIQVSVVLVLVANSVDLANAACSSTYGRCFCNTDLATGKDNVFCNKIPLFEVQKAFELNKGPSEINRFDLVVGSEERKVPADLLSGKSARIVHIATCPAALVIDDLAFANSNETTYSFHIFDCDELIITDSKGFTQEFATGFPGSKISNVKRLIMRENSDLSDGILEAILATLKDANQLEFLSLKKNPLIRFVPDNIKLLPRLSALDMSLCGEFRIITQVNFPNLSVKSIDFSNSSLSRVNNGSFQSGNYSDAQVNLDNNNLIKFEWQVYLEVLQEMSSAGGRGNISIKNNPINCDDCGLAWLVRDLPDLLSFVSGTCANKTQFQDLNASWYEDVKCPIEVDIPTTTESSTTTESTTTMSTTTAATESTKTTSSPDTTTVEPPVVSTTTKSSTTGSTSTTKSATTTVMTTPSPPSVEDDLTNTLFYIIFGILGGICLILIIGFTCLGRIASRRRKDERTRTRLGSSSDDGGSLDVNSTSSLGLDSPKMNPRNQQLQNSYIRMPEPQPPIMSAANANTGYNQNPRGVQPVRRPPVPVITPSVPQANPYTPAMTRVKGLPRTWFLIAASISNAQTEPDSSPQLLPQYDASIIARLELLESRLDKQEQQFKNAEEEIVTLKDYIQELETKLAPLLNDGKSRAFSTTVDGNANRLIGFYPRTCAEARDSGLPEYKQSGMYWIDPDGVGIGEDSIYVYCDMTTGSTLLGHNSEGTIAIPKCTGAGCYSRIVTYSNNVTRNQIKALAKVSFECHQTIRVDCVGGFLTLGSTNNAWWNDIDGKIQTFWSGSDSTKHTCQCGIDGDCVDKNSGNPTLKCNCDANVAVPLTDDGAVTLKDVLPVTKLNFGGYTHDGGSHTLGKMICSGKPIVSGYPKSCDDLWKLGHSLNGFYPIRGDRNVELIFCDFTSSQGSGVQKLIGKIDVKSESVHFYAQSTENIVTQKNNQIITFTDTMINDGNGMEKNTGVFTVPKTGTYLFDFSGSSEGGSDANVIIEFNINDEPKGYAQAENAQNALTTTLPAVWHLEKGNRVTLTLATPATLFNGGAPFTHFIGVLLEEEIFPMN